MAKRDGKQDLNNNDDEGPMPKKSCQWFKDSYQDTWQSWRKSSVRLINEPCLSQCPSRKYYFVVVQLAIEIYSLPVSTANGITFRFQFY